MKKTAVCLLILFFFGNADAYEMGKIQIHGFISQGYLISGEHDFWYTETEDGTFQFNEMGINFSTEPIDNLRIGVQFLSRDLGDIGNNEVKIDWAYGDYYFREWLGIRAGMMKRPYGLHNQSRDVDAARTGILLPTSVYPDISREFYLNTQGIGIYGLIPGNISYEIQYGTVPVGSDDGIVKQAEDYMGCKTESADNEYVIAGQILWDTPFPGLVAGFSAFSLGDSIMETDIGRINFSEYIEWVGSLKFVFQDFIFSAEYGQNSMEAVLNEETVLIDSVLERYYIAASYRFTEWFEFGAGYAVLYESIDDRDGDRYKERNLPASLAWRKDFSLSTRFDINEYWIFKLEGHYIDGLYDVTDEPDETPSEDWLLFGAKVTFSF